MAWHGIASQTHQTRRPAEFALARSNAWSACFEESHTQTDSDPAARQRRRHRRHRRDCCHRHQPAVGTQITKRLAHGIRCACSKRLILAITPPPSRSTSVIPQPTQAARGPNKGKINNRTDASRNISSARLALTYPTVEYEAANRQPTKRCRGTK